MTNYDINNLILETQLIQLKKDSDWWIAGGIAFTIGGTFFTPFWYLSLYSFPSAIIGILVLIKGVSLRKSWKRIMEKYHHEIFNKNRDGYFKYPTKPDNSLFSHQSKYDR